MRETCFHGIYSFIGRRRRKGRSKKNESRTKRNYTVDIQVEESHMHVVVYNMGFNILMKDDSHQQSQSWNKCIVIALWCSNWIGQNNILHAYTSKHVCTYWFRTLLDDMLRTTSRYSKTTTNMAIIWPTGVCGGLGFSKIWCVFTVHTRAILIAISIRDEYGSLRLSQYDHVITTKTYLIWIDRRKKTTHWPNIIGLATAPAITMCNEKVHRAVNATISTTTTTTATNPCMKDLSRFLILRNFSFHLRS